MTSSGLRLRRSFQLRSRRGQRDDGRKAAEVGGPQADVSAVEPSEVAGDGKAETRAGFLRVRLRADVEHDLVGLGRQSGPVVLDGDLDEGFVG